MNLLPIKNTLQRTFKFKSFKHAILKVAKEPTVITLEAMRGSMASSSYLISHTIKINQKDIYFHYNELHEDMSFWRYILDKINQAKEIENRVAGWISLDLIPYIYILTRILKPKIVLETGVGPGCSSAVILRALAKNGFGRLYSIDFPGYDKCFYPKIGKNYDIHVPQGYDTGWLIPSHLRNMWSLILGDAKAELPKILQKCQIVDMFLHDSLHTYEHMMFEYNMAWNHLAKGGLLLSDDVYDYWSTAFIDFCKSKKATHCTINNRLGIAKKN